jgi:hypothetical protein
LYGTAAILDAGTILVAVNRTPQSGAATTQANRPSDGASLFALTASCQPDLAFGRAGTEQLAAVGGDPTEIDSLSPAPDGGAFLAGGTKGGWLVAHIDSRGVVDRSFGTDGSAVIPLPSSGNTGDGWYASALTPEPDGDIIVGLTLGGGCCVQEWVAELDPRGKVVATFGQGGLAPVPAGADSEVQDLVVRPDGEILALIDGGNMGCWFSSIAALTSTGRPVTGFATRFDSAIRRVAPSDSDQGVAYVGVIAPRSGGFMWVGTTQPGCIDENHPSLPTDGRIAVFDENGGLDSTFGEHGWADFPSAMATSAWALPQPDGSVLVALEPYSGPQVPPGSAAIDVVRVDNAGTIDPSYGTAGHLMVTSSFRATNESTWVEPYAVISGGDMNMVMFYDSNSDSDSNFELDPLPH